MVNLTHVGCLESKESLKQFIYIQSDASENIHNILVYKVYKVTCVCVFFIRTGILEVIG